MHSYFRIVSELDRLLKSTLPPDQWDARVAELARRIEREDTRIIPLLFKKLRNTRDSELASLIVFVIEKLEDPTVVEGVLELMRDPSVADEVKIELLPFLLRHGIDLSSPSLAATFNDPQGIIHTLIEWLLDGLENDENAIGSIVENLGQWDRTSQRRWLSYFGERGDERALPLLATVAESHDAELARMAIAEIARIPSGRAVFVLETLFNHRQTLRGEIERALRKLRTAGFAAQPLFPAIGRVRECWLTHIDGYGSQLLLIAREGEGGRYEVALFMLNECEGIKECYSVRKLTERAYRHAVTMLHREMPLIPVSYDDARALVCDALFAARRHGALICPEFAFRRRIFGEDDLTPKEYRPEFPRFLLTEVRRHRAELLAASDRLLTVLPFSEWWFDVPAAHDFVVQEGLHRARGRLRLSRKTVRAFVEKVLEPHRELLIRRFALTAKLSLHLARRRNVSRAIWETTLALWDASRDRRRSLWRIPFFSKLAQMTIEQVMAEIDHPIAPSS
ncbi:MAG: hypothetical protein N0A16_03525 [Blastocatellia bacterium]|nr:hypothetical protein [Blastocatellia bacterium]MCS7156782.1 hypothetical protein [Blastocatellia bacterium]MCX7752740.1 hypothetical protein [Blastocatellia bacterium]MDW8167473.1 hypothetical protein [Acidobacteriota bacterium]MDW8256820.1 hypothetical protein [Acidobacteriota bacterium]